MKLHELEYSAGAKHSKKRKGRGAASGQGKTAGRGENGQKSRSGGAVRPGFEGGQNPLYRRLPKRGFSNHNFATTYETINLNDLNKYADGEIVTVENLKERKIIKVKNKSKIKVLGTGTLDKKLTVKLDKFTKSAKEMIEAKGGNVEEL